MVQLFENLLEWSKNEAAKRIKLAKKPVALQDLLYMFHIGGASGVIFAQMTTSAAHSPTETARQLWLAYDIVSGFAGVQGHDGAGTVAGSPDRGKHSHFWRPA